MKKLTINNHTNRMLSIKYNNLIYKLDSNDSIVLDYCENESLQVQSSKCKNNKFGMYLLNQEFRKVFLFGLVFFMNFISYYRVPVTDRKIDITEQRYNFMFWGMFNILMFNGKTADNYAFFTKKHKIKSVGLLLFSMAPIILLFVFLLYIAIDDSISDFSATSIVMYLCCILLLILIRSMLKSIKNLNNIDKDLKKVLLDSRELVVYKENNHFIKFTVLDDKE